MAINTNPDQYVLGKGRFYFAQYLTSGLLDGYRFIGNVPAFTLTPSTDSLEHISSTSGLNVKDRSIITANDLALAFTTDNISIENQALWTGGSLDLVTATSMTAQTMTIAAPKVGYVYQIGVSTNFPAGVKDITITSVMQGATALVVNVDYVVDLRTGLITLLPSGAATSTSTVITYSVSASTRTQVNNRSATVTGAVKFVSDNPITGAGKTDYEHFLPLVRLAADGDWSLIGEDWQSFGFTGEVIQQYNALGGLIPRHTITPLTPPA